MLKIVFDNAELTYTIEKGIKAIQFVFFLGGIGLSLRETVVTF